MDVSTQNSNYSCCLELHHGYALKKCCFFLLIIFVSMAMVVGVAIAIVAFILKPQKPVFSLQTMRVEYYKLDVHSGSTLFVSSIIALTLTGQNPNKVGIGFSPSRLNILYRGLPVGVMKVPGFYQPPQSYNVILKSHLFFPDLNVSQILSEVSMKKLIQTRIMGDIKAYLQVFHITLPKIKVALDCDVIVDYEELTFKNEFFAITASQSFYASFPAHFQTFSMKCSLALYI